MNLCVKYQTQSVNNIELKHKEALRRIGSKISNSQSNLTHHDIAFIFEIIDALFFDNQIRDLINKKGIELIFDVSSKLTCSAGVCRKYNDNQYQLTISIPIMVS